MKHERSIRGNILVLTILGALVILTISLAAMSLGWMFFLHSRLENFANEMALSGALAINRDDRVGRMNNIVEHSRQLVYSSRVDLAEVTTKYPHIKSFAAKLLKDAQGSAVEVDNERLRLCKAIESEVADEVSKRFEAEKHGYGMKLFLIDLAVPSLHATNVGRIAGMTSNVPAVKVFKGLQTYDKAKQYVGVKGHLYRGSINARLPADDHSLDFKLASLPAPVKGKTAPARITVSDVYLEEKEGQLPSAVRVDLVSTISSSMGASKLAVTGTAATAGAMEEK